MVLFFIIYMWERSFESLHAAKEGVPAGAGIIYKLGRALTVIASF